MGHRPLHDKHGEGSQRNRVFAWQTADYQHLDVLGLDGLVSRRDEYKKNKRPFLGDITLSNLSTAINYRG